MSTFSGVREGDARESGITEIYTSKPEYSNEKVDEMMSPLTLPTTDLLNF